MTREEEKGKLPKPLAALLRYKYVLLVAAAGGALLLWPESPSASLGGSAQESAQTAGAEEALRETTSQIVEAVIGVLERTPPELSADILDRGIVLTGGGAMLRGLEELIEERTGINTMTAEDPMKVVAIGTGQFVEFMSNRKDI